MIRGQKRSLEKVPIINVDLDCLLHNRFDIEVVDAKTGVVKQRAQAENIICDSLWARLLAPNSYFSYIHYGTGAGTPAKANISLFTFLGYGTPVSTEDTWNVDNATGTISYTRKIQLSEVVAVGSTLTEVGIGYGTTAGTLVTHAMLKDMNGNQISIAKTSIDVINIYATVFLHFSSIGYDSGNIYLMFRNSKIVGGTLIGFLLGCGVTGSYGGSWTWVDLFKIIQYTNGGQHVANTVLDNLQDAASTFRTTATVVYSSVNKTITITAARLTVSQANLEGGLCSVALMNCETYGGATYQRTYSPEIIANMGGSWYPGADLTGEAIGSGDGVKKDFITKFPFVKAGAKIYVDNTEQLSGVTIDVDKPYHINNMGIYFVPVKGLSLGTTSPLSVFAPPMFGYAPAGELASSALSNIIYYNPNYQYGIKSFTMTSITTVEISDDLVTWINITAQNTNIPEAYRNYKYWRVTPTNLNGNVGNMVANTLTSQNNIHFDTAPALNAVITADYSTKTIAKDLDHVFDFTLVITLAEKTV